MRNDKFCAAAANFSLFTLHFSLFYRTFAAVKAIRRQLSACILLAVFLPMLIFSSLHIHEIPQTTDTECSDCVHPVAVYVHVCKKYHAQPLCGRHAVCCGAIVTRGPPSA